MITKKELEDFSRLKRMNLGNTEKDYLLDLILFSICKNTKNELVFKGGTCLYKFYKLTRFSEDLDFSAVLPLDVNKLIEEIILDLKRYGVVAWQHQKKEPYNSILITLRIEGPLFAGKPTTYAKVGIDINIKSSVVVPPIVQSYTSLYPQIPSTHVLCMDIREIFAEKIRALLTRTRARDLFDLFFLLQNNISAPPDLIQKKTDYYHEQFDSHKLLLKLPEFASGWEKEIQGLTTELPVFSEVLSVTREKIKEIYPNKNK